MARIKRVPLLEPRSADEIRREMEEARDWRKRTQPLAEPNCGSVFVNPPGDHAARLQFIAIDRLLRQLETRADPSGEIQDLADLRDQRDGLIKMVGELKKENAALRRRLARR